MLTQQEAEERCEAHGGLALFENFKPSPGTRYPRLKHEKRLPEYINWSLTELDVNEGESVWVSGKARYSGFVAWHSCQNKLGNPFKTNIPDNNIYNCWKKCNFKEFDFIGLSMQTCYCIRETDLNSNFCSDTDDSNNIQVYRKLRNELFSGNETFQCAQVVINERVHYKTDKCSARFPGLCTQLINDKHTLKCGKFSDPKNWVDNNDRCIENNGKLLPYLFQEYENYIKGNTRYSIGAFRSFQAIYSRVQFNDLPCLSITRVGNTFWLEPENCLSKRGYLCNNITVLNGASTKTPKNTKEDDDRSIITEKGYTTTLVVLISLLVAVIAAVIYAYVKRGRKCACILSNNKNPVSASPTCVYTADDNCKASDIYCDIKDISDIPLQSNLESCVSSIDSHNIPTVQHEDLPEIENYRTLTNNSINTNSENKYDRIRSELSVSVSNVSNSEDRHCIVHGTAVLEDDCSKSNLFGDDKRIVIDTCSEVNRSSCSCISRAACVCNSQWQNLSVDNTCKENPYYILSKENDFQTTKCASQSLNA
ncbi:hypothetical protein DPMN_079910 [Dreissena polymorpha]|uniref:C-type lectin domain-containing protein n=1 Tax=Dreissena polymorpha TaxID=45954 RepID=A0A9D3YPV7_DREPO|nr:hypothetical protein DPMN_079910 [Dreissena polymorpha]